VQFMQAQEMLARAGLVPQGHIPLTPLQRQRMAALGATPTADATSSTFATPTAPFPSEAVETVTAAAVSDKRGTYDLHSIHFVILPCCSVAFDVSHI
jgi:hypothetical protein